MKKFNKKLTLNKHTLVNIDNENMDSVRGGIPESGIDGASCNTWCNCKTRVWYACPTVWGVDPRCEPSGE